MVAIKEKKNVSTDNEEFRQPSFLIFHSARQPKAPKQKPDVVWLEAGVPIESKIPNSASDTWWRENLGQVEVSHINP